MEDIERELKQSTLLELEDHLGELSDLLYSKKYHDFSDPDFSLIFRVVHSIKGNTKACGFDDIADASHQFESRLIKIKNKEIQFDNENYDLCLSYLNFLNDSLEVLKNDCEASIDFSFFIKQLEKSGSETLQLPKSLNFLVIDDDINIQEIVSEYLSENFECTIQTSNNGLDGISQCKSEAYNVIICDYKMPELDGKEFIKKIRQGSGLNSQTPILFLSGYRPSINADQKMWNNVFFAEKPFTEQKLVYYIRCAVELNKELIA